jgi:2-C-methyl-D-erythritol 4-phosphate cytidylyltransferase
MRSVAIIPAAGFGKRIGGEIPKQFLAINGKELIAYTLDVFQNSELIDEIVVATTDDGIDILEGIKIKYGFTKISAIVKGGEQRQDSVYAALKAVNLSYTDLAAVHDAARALLPLEVLNKALLSAYQKGSALVCLSVRDTIGILESNELEYIDRSKVQIVQTPQIFRYGELLSAFEQAYKDNYYGTDESSLMRRAGYPVHISEGSVYNFKVTTKEDIEIFEKLVKNY